MKASYALVGKENVPPPVATTGVKNTKKRKATEQPLAELSNTTVIQSGRAAVPTTVAVTVSDGQPLSKKAKADMAKAAKAAAAQATADLLDVSAITLDGDEGHDVPVHETCDMVRRKVRNFVGKNGVTQAAFLRAIGVAAHGPGSKPVNSGSYSHFMALKGPLSGNTNTAFYASYVFFEKLRIKQKKPKSADRLEMERVHRHGVDTTRLASNQHYIVRKGTTVAMDKYGSVHIY